MPNNLINYCATIFDEVKTAKTAKTGQLTGFCEKLSTDFSTARFCRKFGDVEN
jgi:hypothetical protein